MDVFVLGLAANGWIHIREGPQRPTLVLLCRELKHSCHVRNNTKWNSRLAPGPLICIPKASQAEKIGHPRKVLKTPTHACLYRWAGEEYYVIMMHYSAWKLFYLQRWSQPAGRTNTPSSDLRCFCAFAYESAILWYAEPCSQPPGGKPEHFASLLCLPWPLFLCKNHHLKKYINKSGKHVNVTEEIWGVCLWLLWDFRWNPHVSVTAPAGRFWTHSLIRSPAGLNRPSRKSDLLPVRGEGRRDDLYRNFTQLTPLQIRQ